MTFAWRSGVARRKMATKNIVDAHALVWYLEGNPRLGVNAKAVLDDPVSELILIRIGANSVVRNIVRIQ